MNNQGLSFNLFGIPTEIKGGFLFLGLFLYTWVNDVGAAVELTIWAGIALLLHELGHAWALKRYHLPPRIELHMLGGMAYSREGNRDDLTNGQNIIIVLAGPAMSILMGVVLLGIIAVTGALPSFALTEEQAQVYPLFFSLGWGILNLIPIYPLDGGQFLRYLLAYNRNWNAELIAIIVGLVLGGLVILYTLSTGQYWNSMIVGLLLMSNVNRLRAINDQKQHPKMVEIDQLVKQNRFGEAMDEIKTIIPQLNSGRQKAWAYQIAAHILIQQNRMEEVPAFIEAFPDYENFIPELKLKLLYDQQGPEAALDYAKKAFALKSTASLALAWVQLLIESRRYDEIPQTLALMRNKRFHAEVGNFAALKLMDESIWDVSIQVSERLFNQHRDGTYAYNVACAYALSSRPEKAIQWLKKAIEAGYDKFDRMRIDSDLASLRGMPEFEVLTRGV